MLIMNILRTIIFYAIAVITFLLGSIITIPFALIVRPSHKAFQFSAKRWARFLLFLSGSKFKLHGVENVPKSGGIIFACNHQGAFDVLIALAFMPRAFRFVAKKELFDIPLFGWYMSVAGYVPIDREISASAHKTMGGVSDVLTKGDAVLIYPEGTRSKTGELGVFKRGSMMAAFASGADVVPVGISGSGKMMPKGTYLINRVPITVNIGKPISYKKYVGIRPSKKDYEDELANLKEKIAGLLLK
jgi:1-acyl-sn-glycerol-3-phosphate acyltransferase